MAVDLVSDPARLPSVAPQVIGNNLEAPTPVPVPARKANDEAEYIAAGPYRWITGFLESLPQYIDDVTRDFGDDLYERMMLDSKVASCINTIKAEILGTPLSLPCRRKDGDADFGKAQEIRDFCQRAIDGMQTPFLEVAWNLLDSLAYGNKVAEKVLTPGKGPDAGRMVIARIKPKPRRTTAFVVDAYNNLIGFLGLIPGVAYALQVQALFADPDSIPNFLPREKFLVMTCQGRDCDPRGWSLLRPAYNAWFIKTNIWPEYLKYLSVYAVPGVRGELPPNAVNLTPVTDQYGNPVVNAQGNPSYQTPAAQLLSQLIAYRNSAALVVANGTNVDIMEAHGDGEAFLSAFAVLNTEISQAITTQTLATEEGKHQTRASSGTHENRLDNVVGYGRSLLEGCLYRDLLMPLVAMNWDEQAAKDYTPLPALSNVEDEDAPELLSALSQMGYAIGQSQLGYWDAKIGAPPRAESDFEQAAQDENDENGKEPNNKKPESNKKPKGKTAQLSSADVTWVTIGGRHIPIGADGKPALDHPGAGGATSEKTPTAKTRSELAKQSAKYVGADIQRYSEEYNEPVLAAGVKGVSLRDNEPVDVVVLRKGVVAHGVELKTMVDNRRGQIHMKASAMSRKAAWVAEHNAPYHTVVFDDHQAYDASGKGEHDDSKRQLYYKRGFGSFRVSSMHPVKDMTELNALMDTPDGDLPKAARPMASYVPPKPKAES